ncbi:histidine kinase [Glycomyces sp. NPDC047010]|uniref:sensor histidine kinase n=1 Tax=Glycomyces sp. NPDC047010 TaxID=3155023 RepID=UPI0033E113CF
MSPEPAVEALGAPPGPGSLDAHVPLDRLLGAQQRLRDFDRRRPWVLDLLVMAFVAVVALPELVLGGTSEGPFQPGIDARAELPGFVPYAFTAALVGVLWWRRRHPGAVALVASFIVFAQWTIGLWQPAAISVLIALYSLASRGRLRVLAWVTAIVVVQTVIVVTVVREVEQPMLGLFFMLGTVTAAGALGLAVRIRRLYTEALEERARQLEVERDQRERLIASTERSRIAREMHDILGHNLSVMVTLADGAATLADKRGEPSAGALRMLGDTGREAMDELRRVLGVLRADGRDPRSLTPQPGVADLDALLERVRAAGLTVTYRTSGPLHLLGSGIQLTVYRIVQEALTNTLKHAGPSATAGVALSADSDRVHISITDTGTAPTGDKTGGDPGHGLIGIRQRAALYGGAATIGPRGHGAGWEVDVVLDRGDAAPVPMNGAHPS